MSPLLLDRTAELLLRGGVIGYPTETVYGLGCDALNAEAANRIGTLKGREKNRPFLVLVSGPDAVRPLVREIPGYAQDLMNRFWPGPLTLVFSAAGDVPESLTRGTGKVGIRVSPDSFCRDLMIRFPHPLVSTSANPSRMPPAQSARQVWHYFGRRLDLIVDGGERGAGIPSTVLDVSGPSSVLIREGAIPVSALKPEPGDTNHA
jgi:L-threonylcarbamoyladenylate synthase